MALRVVVASRNQGKIRELARLLDYPELELVAVDALGLDLPDVVEDGDTLEANALKKAREIAAATGCLALGDDTGLEVDALGGAPGIRSARWSGQGEKANLEKLLRETKDVPDGRRGARFRCVLALVDPAAPDRPLVAHGVCEGRVERAARGGKGFGYDPAFVPAGLDRTMAELDEDEKNALSHRGRAARALGERLAAWLGARS